MQDRYVNPFTDFGFKKLFGEEPHKELLISFLNTLLPEKHQIQDLQYTRNEQQGASILDRKAIFDLSCVSLTGERFIVELQKAKQNYFKDRSLYYATFPIQEQAQRGDWDYKLAAVYTVGILDFTFEEDREAAEKPAQIACFNPAERQAYEDSLKYYRDLKNVMDTAREEGWEEGREEGREEGISIGVERGKQEEQRKVILALSAKSLDAAFIADTLNLSVDFVQQVMAE